MSVASPIFKIMFFGKFREATELAALKSQGASQPYMVTLPEDPPIAMLILCSVLHANTDNIPERPDTACLEHLAILADKYCCTKSLKLLGKFWFTGESGWLRHDIAMPFMWDRDIWQIQGYMPQEQQHLRQLWQLLLFGYLVDLPREFAAIAALMVRLDDGRNNIENALSTQSRLYFRNNIIAALRKERRRCCRRISKAILEPYSWPVAWVNAATSSWKNPTIELLADYTTKLSEVSLCYYPKGKIESSGRSVESLCLAVKTLVENNPKPENQRLGLDSPSDGQLDVWIFQPLCEMVYAIIDEHLGLNIDWPRSHNLCLDCLKTKKQSAAEKKCRIEHIKDMLGADVEDTEGDVDDDDVLVNDTFGSDVLDS